MVSRFSILDTMLALIAKVCGSRSGPMNRRFSGCKPLSLPKAHHSLELLLSSDSLLVTLAKMPDIRKTEPESHGGYDAMKVRCLSLPDTARTSKVRAVCYALRGLKRATSRHLVLTHVQLHHARIQPPVTSKTSSRDRNEDQRVSSSV